MLRVEQCGVLDIEVCAVYLVDVVGRCRFRCALFSLFFGEDLFLLYPFISFHFISLSPFLYLKKVFIRMVD